MVLLLAFLFQAVEAAVTAFCVKAVFVVQHHASLLVPMMMDSIWLPAINNINQRIAAAATRADPAIMDVFHLMMIFQKKQVILIKVSEYSMEITRNLKMNVWLAVQTDVFIAEVQVIS